MRVIRKLQQIQLIRNEKHLCRTSIFLQNIKISVFLQAAFNSLIDQNFVLLCKILVNLSKNLHIKLICQNKHSTKPSYTRCARPKQQVCMVQHRHCSRITYFSFGKKVLQRLQSNLVVVSDWTYAVNKLQIFRSKVMTIALTAYVQ